MKTTELADTGIEVGAVGFGEMQLSIEDRPDRGEALDVLHRAFDLGVTFVDTADSYCIDESDKHHGERLVAEAIATYDGETSDIVVATKGGLMRPDGRWTVDLTPDRLRDTIRTSWEALGGEKPIDLWQVHTSGSDVDVRSALEPAAEAVEEGLVRHVGVSNYSVAEIERAREVVDVVSVQNQWNPWERSAENEVIPYCEDENLTFLPWSPFGGYRRSDSVGDLTVLSEVGDTHGASPHRVLLAWMRQYSPAVLPIPGASRVETLEDSVGSAELELTDGEVERIDRELG